jgi:hypothetical protein
MFNISQPYTGHFFQGEWIPYDDETEKYGVPVIIRFKPQDLSARGVSSGTRQDTLVQEQSGRETIKSSFPIQVVEQLDYKPKDKIRFVAEDKIYTILRVSKGYDSVNSLANLMFPKLNNKPTILQLGSD